MKRRTWVSILAAAAILLLIQGEPWADPVIKEIYYQKKTTLSYPATRTFRFSLWLTETDTDPSYMVWSEPKQVKMTNAYVKTYLGDTTLFDTVPVDFSQQYWVQVDRWNAKKSTWVPVGSRDRLGVVPYALYSETSSGGGGGGITEVTAGSGLTGGGTTGIVNLDVGAGTGITVGANDINVNFSGTGTANTASRSDHNHDATYVKKAGDTMSGTLVINTVDNNALYAAATGSGFAVTGYTTGTGNAGLFQINNPSNSNSGVYSSTNGIGNAVSATTTGSGSAVYGTTSGSGVAVYGYTTGTNIAGRFWINNASNSSDALFGLTNGSGSAVYGSTTGTGQAGFFEINNTGNTADALVGLTTGSGNAVFGYTIGTGNAGSFGINNPSSSNAALYGFTNGSGNAVEGFTSGSGYAGYFSGPVHITGTLTKGSGTFVQPHPTEPGKELVYAFFEGPEHAIFLRGTTKLVGGKAVIETPEYFRVVAGDEGITVQFTPRYVDTFGLAAVEVTKERILVQELKGGRNTYEFDYFVTAKRAGFEKHEPIQPNKHFKADNMTREEFEERYAKTDDMTIAAMRNLLISNGILTKDGKLNMETVSRLGWTLKETDLAMTPK
jgi:hypothetical protein